MISSSRISDVMMLALEYVSHVIVAGPCLLLLLHRRGGVLVNSRANCHITILGIIVHNTLSLLSKVKVPIFRNTATVHNTQSIQSSSCDLF